jgi:hypothetical protein
MRARTGLHANKAGCQLLEESQNITSPEFTSNSLATVSVNAVNLEHILRKVQTDRGNLHGGRLLSIMRRLPPQWHYDAEAVGAVHPINQATAPQQTFQNP